MDSNITLLENSKNFSNILSDNNRSKRVYLVYPDVNSFHGLPYHGGVASLAAVLMQQGYEVKARYMTLESEYPAIIEEILDFQPCVVGFTTVETQFGYVQDLSALIKENYSCVTVVGGSHITLCPESMSYSQMWCMGT